MSSPAAWHPDPSGEHDHRYWDGERWTEHVADGGVASIDPLPATPPETDASSGAGDADHDRGEASAGDVTSELPVMGGGRDTTQGSPWGTDAGRPTDRPAAEGAPVWSGHAASDTSGSWGNTTGANAPSGLAITALVLGILSLPLLIFFGLGALLGVVAVVLGIVAVRKVKQGQASGRGMAIGGIVLGAISVVLGIFVVIALFVFGFGFASEFEACVQETGSQAECQDRLEEQLTDRFIGP